MACNAWNHPPECRCDFRGGHPNSHVVRRGQSERPTQIAAPDPLQRSQFGYKRTRCPKCSKFVYFVRPYNGGTVWFDDLGVPWPKHGCFVADKNATTNAQVFAQRLFASSADAQLGLAPQLTAGAVITDQDMSGLNLRNLDFREIVFIRVSFAGADLSGASLGEATAMKCDFTRATLRGADLGRADLSGSRFELADLAGANLWRADLREAQLLSSRFDRETAVRVSDLQGANCSGLYSSLRGVKRSPNVPDEHSVVELGIGSRTWFVNDAVKKKRAHLPHPRKSNKAICGTPLPPATTWPARRSQLQACAACLRGLP